MSGLIMTAQLLLALSILVIIHEFGHYIAARAFGIKVEKFYLFFDAWGFKLFKYRRGDTEYGVGWLPLGGYVKIAGMIDESMDKEQLKKEPEDWEFRAKPAWQRLIVMVAGVVMNVILGVIIFTGMLYFHNQSFLPVDNVNEDGIYAYQLGRDIGFETGDKIVNIDGEKVERFQDVLSTEVLFGADVIISRKGQHLTISMPDTLYRAAKGGMEPVISHDNFDFVIDSVLEGQNAASAGLRKGDQVIGLNDQEIDVYGDFKERMISNEYDSVQISFLREGNENKVNVNVDSNGLIGVMARVPYENAPYSFGKAFNYGVADAFETIVVNAKGFGKIFSGQEKFRESVSGPIGIAQVYGGQWVWQRFWFYTGLLSMVLAFVNILPIPALDGGHVVFLIAETVSGRKLPDKFMEVVQIIGMILILMLFVFIIGNDILKLIGL